MRERWLRVCWCKFDRLVLACICPSVPPSLFSSSQRGGKGGGDGASEIKKIFVGGIAPSVDDAGFRQYFESYGTITDAIVMMDRDSGRSRGFGFVTFETAVSECSKIQCCLHAF